MFNLELNWNRPNKYISENSSHVLRVSIIPQNNTAAGGNGLPLHLAIALDTSDSMFQDNRLESAKEACRRVVEQLRDVDRLSIAGFSQKVTPIINSILGGNSALAQASEALNSLTGGGNTRTDLALDWFREALLRQDGEDGVIRVAVLITDGNPTNALGKPWSDNKFMLDKAGNLRRDLGVLLYTIGLGNAANFNTQFLVDLSDRGRGQFIYAPTSAELQPQLTSMLARCQSIATEDAKLIFTLSNGAIIKEYCHIRPNYLPPDSEDGIANNELPIPGIRMDSQTDLLFCLDIPGDLSFNAQIGNRPVVSVQLTAEVLTGSTTAQAEINYTTILRDVQKINGNVEQDVKSWQINKIQDVLISRIDNDLNKTGELPNVMGEKAEELNNQTTGELLNVMGKKAEELNNQTIQDHVERQKESLGLTGKLDKHNLSKIMNEVRQSGFGANPAKARFNSTNAYLLVLNGPRKGDKLPLKENSITIGRTDPDGIAVNIDLTTYEYNTTQISISRAHARLEWSGEGLQITDTGSRNGTFVKGNTRLTSNQPYNLVEGSKIRLGNLEFEIITS